MPIIPVTGEIQAQPINDNFSYLDSKTNNISKGSPSGTYATVAALKTAFPSGNNNTYVVTADGKWYYWNGTTWTAGGTYQAVEIADDSIPREKTKYPTRNASQNILGSIDIDLENKKVTCTNNIAISTGSDYLYPNVSQEADIPDGSKPNYIGFLDKQLMVTQNKELENPNAYLVAILYRNEVFAYDYKYISLNGMNLSNRHNNFGNVVYGNIIVHRLDKKIVIQKGTIISSVSGNFNYAEEKDIELSYTNENETVFLVLDKRTKTFKLIYNIGKELQIVICSILNGKVFKNSQTSNIVCYPTSTFENNSLNFIKYTSFIDIIDTSSDKKIIIPAGQTPIASNSSLYFRNSSEITIDFADFYSKTNFSVVSLFMEISSTSKSNGNYDVKDFYVDYSPKNVNDIKIFSYYNNCVYGMDDISRSSVRVNGVLNGGWGLYKEFNYKISSLDAWFSKTSSGQTSNLMWLGDSTWTLRDGGKSVPFFEVMNKYLDDYFGENTIKSVNNSIAGKDIIYMGDQLETFLQESSNIDILFVGCALNNISSSLTKKREAAFEKIVNLCQSYNILPVFCTAQANQVPNVKDGDDWINRSHFNTEKFDRPLRLSIAEKYGLEVIDITSFTQKILNNSPEKINELVPDGLHASYILQNYQADWFFAQIVPTVKKLEKSSIITIYDQKVFSALSLSYVDDITRDENGFKSEWNYTASADDVLMDVWIYLEPNESTLWNIFTFLEKGSLSVTINDTNLAISTVGKYVAVENTKSGLYHIVAKANQGPIIFKGFSCELISL